MHATPQQPSHSIRKCANTIVGIIDCSANSLTRILAADSVERKNSSKSNVVMLVCQSLRQCRRGKVACNHAQDFCGLFSNMPMWVMERINERSNSGFAKLFNRGVHCGLNDQVGITQTLDEKSNGFWIAYLT